MNDLSKIILIFLCCLSGCGLNDVRQVVTFEDKFAIDLPVTLTKLKKDVVPDASLVYGNTFTDFYTFVIEDFIPTPEDIEQGQTMQTNLEEISLEDYLASYKEAFKIKKEKLITIGEFPAYYIEEKINENNTEMFLAKALLKGQKGFYQITTIVPLSKKEKYKLIMQEIIYSFREYNESIGQFEN